MQKVKQMTSAERLDQSSTTRLAIHLASSLMIITVLADLWRSIREPFFRDLLSVRSVADVGLSGLAVIALVGAVWFFRRELRRDFWSTTPRVVVKRWMRGPLRPQYLCRADRLLLSR
jgi:hypothetical protein